MLLDGSDQKKELVELRQTQCVNSFEYFSLFNTLPIVYLQRCLEYTHHWIDAKNTSVIVGWKTFNIRPISAWDHDGFYATR